MALDLHFRHVAIGGACLLSVVLCSEAHASSATAQACADKLNPEARAIYDRAAPSVTPSTDLAPLLKSTVPGMVFSGDVKAATARDSAMAAVPCLKDLKSN